MQSLLIQARQQTKENPTKGRTQSPLSTMPFASFGGTLSNPCSGSFVLKLALCSSYCSR